MRGTSGEAATTIRTAMAIVTADLARDHQQSHSLARDLDRSQARFALLVTSEYLAQAIRELAERDGITADALWQRYCLRTEAAIDRVDRNPG